MKVGMIRAGAAVVLSVAMGCASKQTPADAPSAAGSSSAQGAAGSAAPAPPKERPFARTALEAQSLIQEQIEDHMSPLLQCVNDLRRGKSDVHLAVVVDIGIDQEGQLLGITTPNIKKGDLDPAMRDCMMKALRPLPFPKSHAGIITVRQAFTDVVVQQ